MRKLAISIYSVVAAAEYCAQCNGQSSKAAEYCALASDKALRKGPERIRLQRLQYIVRKLAITSSRSDHSGTVIAFW